MPVPPIPKPAQPQAPLTRAEASCAGFLWEAFQNGRTLSPQQFYQTLVAFKVTPERSLLVWDEADRLAGRQLLPVSRHRGSASVPPESWRRALNPIQRAIACLGCIAVCLVPAWVCLHDDDADAAIIFVLLGIIAAAVFNIWLFKSPLGLGDVARTIGLQRIDSLRDLTENEAPARPTTVTQNGITFTLGDKQ